MGFEPADGDRLVSAFSGGWQMRMSLGSAKNLIYCCWTSQQPLGFRNDWAGNLPQEADYPDGNCPHDREFLIASVLRLWNERGVSATYLGNYPLIYNKSRGTKYQLSAYERQQKELENSKPC